MASYATAAESARLAGIKNPTEAQTTALQEVLPGASAQVDAWTKTWWDKRRVTFRTNAVEPYQSRLFMPAKILSIVSITIGTTSPTVVDPADFTVFNRWVRLKSGYWTREPLAIQIVGDLGETIVPEDIKLLTKALAASMSGLAKKSYITADGIQATVNTTSIPEWAQKIIDSNRFDRSVSQPIVFA
jgi:hypothetical protein